MTTNTNTLTNTEILDGLILEVKNTYERLVDTGSSIQITRKVEPEDGTGKSQFKDIHNRIKDIVETDFMKTKGSNKLIETIQELKLVPSNDEEKEKLSVLRELLWKHNIGKEEYPYDKSTLDRLFSGNASFQRVELNNKYLISSTNLNEINELVNDFFVGRLTGQLRTELPTLIDNEVSVNLSHFRSDPKNPELRDYQDMLSLWMDIDLAVRVPENTDFSVEYINSLDPSFLFQKLSSVKNELGKINISITEYEEEISIGINAFLELFPSISQIVEDQITHSNKLVRKTVKVEVTRIYEMEIDVVDEGDIEPELEKILKDKNEISSSHLKTSKGDPIKELSSKFGDISILEVNDFKEEIGEVA